MVLINALQGKQVMNKLLSGVREILKFDTEDHYFKQPRPRYHKIIRKVKTSRVDRCAPPSLYRLISVTSLSVKKEVSEYLRKQPASTELPPAWGGHVCTLTYALDKHVPQSLWLIFLTHCATTYTVAIALGPPSKTCLFDAAKKLLIFGVAAIRSVNSSSTAGLKAVGLGAVRLLIHTPDESSNDICL